jgi:A/G-specific adenine glycosylase
MAEMQELHEWFQENKRTFPWREDPTPYKVWISEVMLQQTRASVVIPYFHRWMTLFPTVQSLAEAPLEKVIKAWEGLGYYSRARNLHKGAHQIVERFGGEIPSKRENLETIQGLGPYTVGAILSFGFRKRAAAVDGNVIRVITRYFSIEENVCRQSVKREIVQKAEGLLDGKEPWVTVEALIELGATLCTPKPRCLLCPLQKSCRGQSKAELLPIKNAEKETTHLKRAVIWLEADGKVLVKKGEAGKVMADLYEFPYFEMDAEWSQDKLLKKLQKEWGIRGKVERRLPKVSHTFTRYKADLFPYRISLESLCEIPGYEWVAHKQLKELPFSSGHRRILKL